jgi:Fe-S cluster assembly ATPase SufC
MSWDKNTIKTSEIDGIVRILDLLKEPYTLGVKLTVSGRGLNDEFRGGRSKRYDLRRLQVRDIVILEQIEQDGDCDTDDIIRSEIFNAAEEPKDWHYIIRTDKTGEYPDWIGE